MNNIEETIRKNKGFFDDAEPQEGHLERFSYRLSARFGMKKKINIGPYLLRAAAVTLLLTLSSLWTWEHFIRPDNNQMSLSEVSPEYREVEQFYVQQVNMIEGEILGTDIGTSEEHKAMLQEELKNMDASYKDLQKELAANPTDERVINAMIEHYQKKLEVMTYILNQLKEVKNSNQIDSHEKATI
jgi:Xaa-Pro aminopeptidase